MFILNVLLLLFGITLICLYIVKRRRLVGGAIEIQLNSLLGQNPICKRLKFQCRTDYDYDRLSYLREVHFYINFQRLLITLKTCDLQECIFSVSFDMMISI